MAGDEGGPAGDRPSLAVVALGGLGVLAVVAFVASLALGGGTVDRPGDRVAVVAGPGPLGATVLAARCREERVTAVALHDVTATGGRGPVRWRIESAKGSIERSYSLGGPPPVGFEAGTPLAGTPAGRVEVVVTFDRPERRPVDDARVVDLAELPAAGELDGDAPAPCGGRVDLGFTTLLFAVGGLAVVVTYGMVLRRRWPRPR
ncbi:MAG: hypothetical protein AB7H43_13595 [Acidimicrobiia bacterium]